MGAVGAMVPAYFSMTGQLVWINIRQNLTRSTRRTVKLCDELTVVSDGVVTS